MEKQLGHRLIDVINGGAVVLCDICNNDGDAKNDDGSPMYLGGGLIGDDAVCPECVQDMDKLDVTFDPSKSFGDNVRAYRREVFGTEDSITMIFNW